ncbi:MAG: hypothetical protein KIS81_10500 [Maricaulaceae bacterium]|nr:hypothetical protein [Maricaulaceae bacterium]
MSAAAPISERADLVIAQAARATGADFDYLIRTAARESNFDANAQARTSSAAGMFQFIEQTWLGMMRRHGAAHGYAAEAASIEQGADGRFRVSDPQRRQEILDLRFDARLSAMMAGRLAAENAATLQARFGRAPTAGELYAAHFLGAAGAGELIAAAGADPDARADRLFPDAARANRNIFFDGGRPRSASEVLANLTGGPANVSAAARRTAAPAVRAAENAGPSAPAPQAAGAGPRRYGRAMATTVMAGGAVLSPAVVEILASLGAPERANRRNT